MSTEIMKKIIADYFKTQPVLKAWLFGSFARGEETPRSDVDILFVPDYSGKPFTLFTHGGMLMDLQGEKELGTKATPLTILLRLRA